MNGDPSLRDVYQMGYDKGYRAALLDVMTSLGSGLQRLDGATQTRRLRRF